MEKNQHETHFWKRKCRKKRDFLCRRLALVWMAVMLMTTTLAAQEQKVTIDVKQVDISLVFQQIKEQTGLNFMYNTAQLAKLSPVTLQVKNVTVDSALTKLFAGQPFEWRYDDNYIIIREKTAQHPLKPVTITGRVTDEKKQPLPGVTVKLSGASIGTATDVEGRFSIGLPMAEGTLEFSFVGYASQKVRFTATTDTLHVELKVEATELEEVVSLGYFNVDRRKSTSAITSLKMDDIMQPGVSTLDQMLEGRVPGMIFMQNSGQVGASPKIKIRGTTTLLGSTEPLWVLDGVILDSPVNVDPQNINDLDFVNLLGNAISGLNPADIEQIDVLKDASATAIYGPQASNGVIVITTKKGHEGSPSVSYNVTGTFRRRPRYSDRAVDVMNSKERIAYSREAIQAGWRVPVLNAWVGYEAAYSDYLNNVLTYDEFVEEVSDMELANTDWLELLMQDTYSHNHTLSVSGGSRNLRYYSSVGFMDEKGNVRGEDNKRYTAMVNLNLTYDKWNFRFGLNGNLQKKKYTPTEVGAADYAYNTSRSVPAYTKDGELLYYDKDVSSNYRQDFNIINEMKNSWNHIDTDQIGLQLILGYRIIPSLKFDATFAYNVSHTEDDTWYGEDSWHVLDLKKILKVETSLYGVGEQNPAVAECVTGGELRLSNTKNESYNFRGTFTFNKGLTEKQSLNASLIGEFSSSKYSGFSITRRNYMPDRGMIFDDWDHTKYTGFNKWLRTEEARGRMEDDLTRKLAAILSVSWSWENTYILNGNMRMDWSNKFGDRSNEKFLPIWSISGRWNMHENVLYGVSWVNTFALKLSFGYQGNMSETESPRLIINKKGTDTFFDEFYSEIDKFPNPVLSWEKTSTFNGSVEFSLFNNKLTGNLGYYYRHTSDAFMNKTVSIFNGTQKYTVNAGTLVNQGFEFSFQFTPINNMINQINSSLSASGERRGFRWRFDPNFGSVFNQLIDKIKPKDKVLQDEIEIEDYLNGSVQVAGRPVNTFYSFRFKGLDHNTGAPIFYGAEADMYPATDEHGNLLYDYNGNPKMNNRTVEKYNKMAEVMSKEDIWMSELLTHSGCREPFLQGSIYNTFEYNNWILSFNLAYSLGSKIRLFKMYANGGSLPAPEKNMRREWTKRWRVPGDESSTTVPGIVGGNAYREMVTPWWKNQSAFDWGVDAFTMYDNSDLRVASGNYLKLASLQLRYVVPNRLCKRLYMQSAYLSVSGTNLFTLCSKELKGQDPSQSGSSELINISVRPTYSLTLNVTF